ncbi:hypothetical protein B0J11DRAFT_15428 [Dendryphion nanum]|uniref:Uncharacterized protein n=1 Tax=Dendryphion nanum TaxID=256645 RepID=A0A9P9EJV6_9PLEO|nr:hypothetical protein B0J11DRAFT_15428 [Dendryphion nanum]
MQTCKGQNHMLFIFIFSISCPSSHHSSPLLFSAHTKLTHSCSEKKQITEKRTTIIHDNRDDCDNYDWHRARERMYVREREQRKGEVGEWSKENNLSYTLSLRIKDPIRQDMAVAHCRSAGAEDLGEESLERLV